MADLPGRLVPPASSLEGWIVAEGPVGYSPETLYDYLDGGAPRYVEYGFRRLVHVRYQRGDDPLAAVTLDVFDMGSPLGAFGIYRIGRPPAGRGDDGCAEGHRSGTLAAAWKGAIYVHAEADDGRPELLDVMNRLVGSVCGRVPGDVVLPDILAPLPSDGVVPGSERYVPRNLLGHAFLPGGVLATYRVGDREAELLFSDLGTPPAAEAAAARLLEHHRRTGTVDGEVPSVGGRGFRYAESGTGSGAWVATGRFVAAVQGAAPQEAQERLLRALVQRLESAGPAR